MTDAEKLDIVRTAFKAKLEAVETPAEMMAFVDNHCSATVKAYIKSFIQDSAAGNTGQAAEFTTEATEKNDYADEF